MKDILGRNLVGNEEHRVVCYKDDIHPSFCRHPIAEILDEFALPLIEAMSHEEIKEKLLKVLALPHRSGDLDLAMLGYIWVSATLAPYAGALRELIDEGSVIWATGQVAREVWYFVNPNKAQ